MEVERLRPLGNDRVLAFLITEFGVRARQVQNDPSNIRLLGPADCKVEPLHRRYVHLTGDGNGYRVALPLCLDL